MEKGYDACQRIEMNKIKNHHTSHHTEYLFEIND